LKDRAAGKAQEIYGKVKGSIPGMGIKEEAEPEPQPEEKENLKDKLENLSLYERIKSRFFGSGNKEEAQPEPQPEEKKGLKDKVERYATFKTHEVYEKVMSHIPGSEKAKETISSAASAANEEIHKDDNGTLSEKLHAAAHAAREKIPGIHHHEGEGVKGKIKDKVTDKVLHVSEKVSGIHTAEKVMDKVEKLYEKGKHKIPGDHDDSSLSDKFKETIDYVAEKLKSVFGSSEPEEPVADEGVSKPEDILKDVTPRKGVAAAGEIHLRDL